jgi:glutathione S-transferase
VSETTAPVPTYRLFWYPGTCSRVAFVALEEIGIPYDLTLVDRMRRAAPWYLAINPKGKVPALATDGRTITENPAIQTYLARRHPEACLLPVGNADIEIDVLETISWFAAGVHPLVTRLRFPRVFSDLPESHPGIRTIACHLLEEAFAILEARLGDRDWLYGEWSIVDAYMLWLWFRATGSGMPGGAFPHCAAHARRCEARPSVAKVLDREEFELERLRVEGLLPANLPDFQVGRAPAH